MTGQAGATTLRSVINGLEGRFRTAGVVSARSDAEWLLAASLGLTRTGLYLREDPLDVQSLERVEALAQRRLAGEPLQYLLGDTQFLGLRFKVSPDVLIPRPETEVLAERAIRDLRARAHTSSTPLRALDVGTGSANLAISLAHAVPTCVVVALELSWDALRVARENVEAHHVGERVHLIQADWTSGVRGPVDVLLSNPPYVPGEAARWSAQHGSREPLMSRDGGTTGMAFHHRLIADAPRLLVLGGAMGLECAEDQALPLADLLTRTPWVRRVEIFEDLAGRPRGVWIERAWTH